MHQHFGQFSRKSTYAQIQNVNLRIIIFVESIKPKGNKKNQKLKMSISELFDKLQVQY